MGKKGMMKPNMMQMMSASMFKAKFFKASGADDTCGNVPDELMENPMKESCEGVSLNPIQNVDLIQVLSTRLVCLILQ